MAKMAFLDAAKDEQWIDGINQLIDFQCQKSIMSVVSMDTDQVNI